MFGWEGGQIRDHGYAIGGTLGEGKRGNCTEYGVLTRIYRARDLGNIHYGGLVRGSLVTGIWRERKKRDQRQLSKFPSRLRQGEVWLEFFFFTTGGYITITESIHHYYYYSLGANYTKKKGGKRGDRKLRDRRSVTYVGPSLASHLLLTMTSCLLNSSPVQLYILLQKIEQ